jgi:Ser/Thr protein kinase RdoA (MazF antagonist)
MEALADQDVTAILASYRLGRLNRYVRVERGYVNQKWLLDTETGRYLLKRRHPSLAAPELILGQHALVQHLRHWGFAVPAVIPTRDGNTFLVQGGNTYELQEYNAGVCFDAQNQGHLVASARLLGVYHCAVEGFDHPALRRSRERYGPEVLVATIQRLRRSWQGRMPAQLEPLLRELDRHAMDLTNRFMGLGRLPQLVIHGDYHGGNLLFKGNEVVCVVDFDLAHVCSRATEVAEALIAFATDDRLNLRHIVYPGSLDLERTRRFLVAYCDEARLSDAEIRALPDLIRTIWLCAALDPPLAPLLTLEAAPQALPEVLTLADWARTHAAELVELALVASR